MRIGVDIGGTFTDAVAIDADGTIQTAKAPTTPGHLHDGVLEDLLKVNGKPSPRGTRIRVATTSSTGT